MIEQIGNADNVGGIFRNAAAFGAAGVLLSPGCCDPLYRKAVRTSMGACLQLPFTTIAEWPQGLATLRQVGYHLVAMTPSRTASALHRCEFPKQARGVAILLGSEGEGLSAGAVAHTDASVRIETRGAVDSLNVATAAAIALHELENRAGRLR